MARVFGSGFVRAAGRVAIGLGALGAASGAFAQGWIARGAQFQVNGTVTSDQLRPSAAMADDGSFVVVWESFVSPGNDASARSVQARRFSAACAPIAAQFQVNTTTSEEQKSAAIAMNGAGAFVVVFESDSLAGAGTDFDIRGRLFDAAGDPDGDDFPINATTTQEQNEPAVAMRGDGEFTVVWESDVDATPTSNLDVLIRSFSAAGVPLASEQGAATSAASTQQAPAIATNASGDLAVAWQSSTSAGDDDITESVQARFAPANQALGSQVQVNLDSPITGDFAPALAMAPDGSFVVLWESNASLGTDAALSSIQARLYDSNGSPLTQALQINNHTPDAQRFPSVAMDADGRFVGTFQSYGSPAGDASEWSVQVRGQSASGGDLGSQTQANGYGAGVQDRPAVAMNGSGALVVVWESQGSPGDDASGYSIQARCYTLPTIFADGFESGDPSRWSS